MRVIILLCLFGLAFEVISGVNVGIRLYSNTLEHDPEKSNHYIDTRIENENQGCLDSTNAAQSYCAYGPGFWIGYSQPNFESDQTGNFPYVIMGRAGATENCDAFNAATRGRIGSYRFAGLDDAPESITFFNGTYFEGVKHNIVMTDEIEDISDFHFASMLIFGTTNVQMFQRVGFAGLSFCLDPSSPDLSRQGQVEDMEDQFGLAPGDVKSIRRNACTPTKTWVES